MYHNIQVLLCKINISLSDNVDQYQTAHSVPSDLDQHCPQKSFEFALNRLRINSFPDINPRTKTIERYLTTENDFMGD